MKRARTIKIDERAGISGKMSFILHMTRLTKEEQDHVFEVLTDSLAEACRNIPYRQVHHSDLVIKPVKP